jgi:hypothetical protein
MVPGELRVKDETQNLSMRTGVKCKSQLFKGAVGKFPFF